MTNYSSFWLDDNFDNDIDILTGESIVKPGKDLIKLAGYQRAIANFVNIVTGKHVPVKFKQNGNSYTDGKSIVISSSLKDKDFDPAVGLALHEGSHILLSDFQFLKDLESHIPADITNTVMIKYDYDRYNANYHILNNLKDLLNIVEDRRIDNYVFKSAPGYKGYYHSMYDKYFNSKIIDKGLASSEFRIPTFEAYMFRICNITNNHRDLNALPGLRKIWNLMDLKNIGDVKSTEEAFQIACEIYKVIEENIEAPKPEDNDCDGNCDGDGNEQQTENRDGGTPKTPEGESDDDGSTTTGTDCTNGNTTSTIDLEDLTDKQKQQLKKAIQKQKSFQDGDIKKGGMSKKDASSLNAIQQGDVEVTNVGNGVDGWRKTSGGTNCIVINGITKTLIDENPFDVFINKDWYGSRMEQFQHSVDKGLVLGQKLGRKLQVRNEENSLRYTRLNTGKIDKRLIASLGYGAESVFEQVFTSSHNDANVHISVDASGSMSGRRYNKAMTTCVAIAKAASMVGNLNVQISFRTTVESGGTNTPCIVIAYDSRKDKIVTIKSLFKYCVTLGTTPEGLCFEAIQKHMVQSNGSMDSYFINLSDGEPYFENRDIQYWGQTAASHTAKQVKNMRGGGIEVLSYYIDGGSDVSAQFKTMYGASSASIDTNNLTQLATTLNKLFLGQ
tara:strand:+ start:6383 stop:8392 length:2010 start_codon:yes stop_codon:yes gene_type:complete